MRTLPNLRIVYGQFATHPIMLPLSDPTPINPPVRLPIEVPVVSTTHGKSKSQFLPLDLSRIQQGKRVYVPVHRTEEKGSDVNLATYLLRDAFRGEYEAAIIVSNDSDLAEPLRLVKQEMGKRIVIISPYRTTGSKRLRDIADEFHSISESILKLCQFPPLLRDSKGDFQKPAQ